MLCPKTLKPCTSSGCTEERKLCMQTHHVGNVTISPKTTDIPKTPPQPQPLMGWICPVCHRGNSPYIHTCACTIMGYTVTSTGKI